MTNLVTSIDELATETILEIFEYLSSNDIIYTFFDVNQRFNSILFHHQYCLNDFKTPKTNLHFWQNILFDIGSNIQHLIITTNDFSFSLNLFPNLKSIVILSVLPIGHSLLQSLLENERFNQLNSFKIQSEIFHKTNEYNLFKNIFHQKNSLNTFECLSKFSSHNSQMIHRWQINENLHALSLKIENCIYAFSFLQYTPNLKYFKLIGEVFLYNQIMNEHLDLSNIKLKKFDFIYKRYNMNYLINEHYFRILTNFIEHFQQWLIDVLPNFKHLILPVIYDFIPIIYNKIQRLTIREVEFLSLWKQSSGFYFPNLKYIEIELLYRGPYDFKRLLLYFVECTTLILYFRLFKDYYENDGEIDINKMFDKLDLIEIFENYEIKYGYNCFEFTRKTNI